MLHIGGGLSTRDHPRRCGENNKNTLCYGKDIGSPPQVRGKHCKLAVNVAGRRITPAGAGKTLLFLDFENLLRDHPRGCGENGLYALRLSKCLGSPPRMRGKQSTVVYRLNRRRITPADAGKTCRLRALSGRRKDHPRRCGENIEEVT